MNRRHPFDNLGAWLLIVLGGLLLVAGATSFVRAALGSDWIELLVTAALMVLISFGVAHAVSQLRRDRSAGSDPDEDES